MTGLISMLLTVFTLISSVSGAIIGTGNTVSPTDDFVPVMRFAATSDTHVSVFGDKQCARITRLINAAYGIAESDPDYKELDAVVFSGDLTDKGSKLQFTAFDAVTSAAVKGDTELLSVVARSHDCNRQGTSALDFFTELTGRTTDFHKVINGFHFIGISASRDSSVHYDAAQLAWLDAQLANAVADKPLQPVFVFQHEHISDTVYGSYDVDGWGVDFFTDILSKYPQVVDISGHSHYPANDPRAVWQGIFTAINDGGLAYFEFTVDEENQVHPTGNRSMAQALIVEVDAQNRVLVRVYDVTADCFVYSYLIDNVASPIKLKYSHIVRTAVASAPEFDSGAEIKVTEIFNNFSFTVPQAAVANDDIVFLYRLNITDENGNTVVSKWELSEYYFADVPNKISFKNIRLSGGKYTVSITAEDAWGIQSEALTMPLSV